MKPFEYRNPTRIVFGENAVEKLPAEISRYGNKVILVYGGRSIEKNGNLEQIHNLLEANGIEYWDFGGVKAPKLSTLYELIGLAKKEKPDLLIGIGSGTVIDTTKAAAAGASYDGNVWDILSGRTAPETLDILPIAAVVTLPGSGSEMDGNAEIQNDLTGEHGSIGSCPKTYPAFSILDPVLASDTPWELTFRQGFMIIGQVMEQTLADVEWDGLQTEMAEAIIRNVMRALERLKDHPEDHQARGVLSWGSALTCNRIIGRGKSAAWLGGAAADLIEEALEIPYGEAMLLTWPKLLITLAGRYPKTLSSFSRNVMKVNDKNLSEEEAALQGARAFQEWVISMGGPRNAADLGINRINEVLIEEKQKKLAERNVLSADEIKKITDLAIGRL